MCENVIFTAEHYIEDYFDLDENDRVFAMFQSSWELIAQFSASFYFREYCVGIGLHTVFVLYVIIIIIIIVIIIIIISSVKLTAVTIT